MNAFRALPAALRWALLVGLLGLAVAVPFSAPDGTGMQWDELVLGSVASTAAWALFRRTRSMDRAAARAWYPSAVGALLFATAQFLAGAFPGTEFEGFGVDDVILLVGASAPLVTCGLLARRVSRTRRSTLAIDGLVITVALIVLVEVLRTPLVNPMNAPEDLRSLVLAYGGYAALMLGFAGALCTVATRALRPAVTALMVGIAFQATAAAAEANAIVTPSMGWVAVSDAAVVCALLSGALAAYLAPLQLDQRGARASAPVVSRLGLGLVVVALLSLPAAISVSLFQNVPLSDGAEFGCAVVFALMALRLVLRIREDGQVSEVLVRSEEDFRELVEASSDGVAIIDGDHHLLFTSPAARRLLAITDPDADVSLLDIVAAEDRALLQAATSGQPLHVHVPTGDGSVRELEVTSAERPGGDRHVVHLRDVTSRRRRERELERMAYTDHLTTLPNRALLFQELTAAATAEQRCLLVLDLDGFKAVNDTAGHEAGDQLLVEVARRLHTVVRDDDLVARLGGDEFAVLVTGTLAEAQDVAQRIVDVLGVPHRTAGGTFAVGASVGVAPLSAAGGQAAFRAADAALREAKWAGKGCVRLAGVVHLGMEDEPNFHDVVAEGEFHLRFATVCAPDGTIRQVTTLPVWSHPVRGSVAGLDLWGFAERQGRTADLQRWLLAEACRVLVGLDAAELGVAVTLPAGHVVADGLAAHVGEVLAGAGLDPGRLTLIFTEETLLTSTASLLPELEAVRRSGVRLCLDNYGMGHSLFALLARITLDCVRVDLQALGGPDDVARALRVLAAITDTARGFDMGVIADGVGSEEMRRAALDAGAPLLQGPALPHGLTAADIAALLATTA